MNKIFKKFFLFIFLLFFTFLSPHADSTKIYKKEYQNPKGVLNSFLWNDKQGGYIGLTPKINISSRNLNHTIHPVSINSFKIKAAFSKLKYKNIENEEIYHIFNTDNLEVLSKNISRRLSSDSAISSMSSLCKSFSFCPQSSAASVSEKSPDPSVLNVSIFFRRTSAI